MINLRFDTVPPGPNDHMNYRERASKNRKWRDKARNTIQEECNYSVPRYEKVKITAVIYRTRLGVSDEDNDRSRLKPVIDGLRDSGLFKDDTRKYILWGTVTEERGASGFTLKVEEAVNCTRCGQLKETEPFLLGTYFCLQCYGKMILGYMNSHLENSIEEYLKLWLQTRVIGKEPVETKERH